MNIEKNVPLPDKSVRGAIVKALKLLDIDDSVLVTRDEGRKVHSTAFRIKIKCITRREGDMVRVWRIA